ncbi:TIR domain-containing protein [Saccharopolyspora elongata]|uniref:TIR domain-containing protein n=1 Tax=Saccharopolyspora elongata TaxID=2530387 RepID=UPI00140478F1|nr:TIR domain-containing protein [Saccharopolyspora elongata]
MGGLFGLCIPSLATVFGLVAELWCHNRAVNRERNAQYDAFISYSHALDDKLAPAVQNELERFAKPWYRPRVLRVFRDEATMGANPGLWPAIENALRASRWFILLASPEAAASKWVAKEVDLWLRERSADTFLIALTSGDLAFDENGEVDWSRTDALPEVLRDRLPHEPRWIDLRNLNKVEHIDREDPRFREAVADLAAPLHGVDKDTLIGGHIREHRRTMRTARIAGTTLVVLMLLATAGLAGSIMFQRQAEQEGNRNLARFLAAEAEVIRERQPGLAKQLSLLSYQMDREAGRDALSNSQQTPGVINEGQPATDLATSSDGRVLAISTRNEIVLRDGRGTGSGRIDGQLVGPIALSRDGRTLAAATYDNAETGPVSGSTTLRLWDITDLTHPREIAASTQNAAITALTLNDSTLYAGTAVGEILLWDVRDQAPTSLPTLGAHAATVDSLAVAPQRKLLASMGVDGKVRLWDVANAASPVPVTELAGAAYERRLSEAKPLHRVAFDASGDLLATPGDSEDGDDKLNLWRIEDPRNPRLSSATTEDSGFGPGGSSCWEGVSSLAFSPANQHIVGACGVNWQVWSYGRDNPDVIGRGATSTAPSGGMQGNLVVFDPSTSRRLLQATDHGVLVWDLSNAAQPGAKSFLPVPPAPGAKISYRAFGQRHLIAYQSYSGGPTNTLVDVTDPQNRALLGASPAPNMYIGQDISLSPDGSMLAAAEVISEDGDVGVRLRSTADPEGEPLSTITELDNGIGVLAFSPTAPILVISDYNGVDANNHAPPTLRMYDIANPRQPRQLAQLPVTVTSVVFSPDGAALTASADRTQSIPDEKRAEVWTQLRTWNITDPANPTELWTHDLPARDGLAYDSFEYRPDGALFAMYTSAGLLQLWHVDQHRLVGEPVNVRVGESGKLTFSPDGTHLALISTTDSSEQRIEIWDVSVPGAPVRQFHLPSAGASFYSFAYSPDGRTLAVTRADAGVDLWDTDPSRIIPELCNAIGDPISPQQWQWYLPNRPYAPPCQQP